VNGEVYVVDIPAGFSHSPQYSFESHCTEIFVDIYYFFTNIPPAPSLRMRGSLPLRSSVPSWHVRAEFNFSGRFSISTGKIFLIF
jgi:hypothetical protein